MLHVIVTYENGNSVEAPFDTEFNLREQVLFERQFGKSIAVLQRWVSVSEARAAKAEALGKRPEEIELADDEIDSIPPQEHMAFMVWLLSKKADRQATPAFFDDESDDCFLVQARRFEFVNRETPKPAPAATGNGASPEGFELDEPEAPSSGPTSPAAPSRS